MTEEPEDDPRRIGYMLILAFAGWLAGVFIFSPFSEIGMVWGGLLGAIAAPSVAYGWRANKPLDEPDHERIGRLLLWAFVGGLVGALVGGPFGVFGAGWGALFGAVSGPFAGFALGKRPKLPSADPLIRGVAGALEDGRAEGAQAAGRHGGQTVRFWTERSAAPGELQLNCSVRAARGEVYLDGVAAEDLDHPPFPYPGHLIVRPGGIRMAWSTAVDDALDVGEAWVAAILAEADARRTPESQRLARLAALAEADKPSAVDVLLAEELDDPRIPALAARLADAPAPGPRLVAARWQGAAALDGLIDGLDDPRWQARALRLRVDAGPLPPDAIQRWAGVPALHLELLIDQTRRGPLDAVAGLVASAPVWPDAERFVALAAALAERGAEVEDAARQLFEGQPAGRQALARALGQLGGMPALMTLRSALSDWPTLDAEEAAIQQAIALIVHRLGDAATGALALDVEDPDAGALSLGAEAEGGLTLREGRSGV